MATYRAFGLTIGSDMALAGPAESEGTPDVVIRRAPVPEWQGEATIEYADRVKIRGQEQRIHFPAPHFTGWIRDGNSIQFEADPADDAMAGLHLLGSCTGAVLFQRGLIPLHGNTVATTHGTLVVAGRIGSGKSTTTLELLQRGHRLLADDVSAVDFDGPELQVMPGFPRLKLWKATLDQFGLDAQGFQLIRAEIEKFHYPVDGQFCDVAQRPSTVYVLRPGDAPGVRVRVLAGVEKLHALRAQVYQVRVRDAMQNWVDFCP